MTNRLLSLLLLTAPLAVTAQERLMTEERYLLADETQLWHDTRNAAGLALDMRDSTDNRGTAFFDFQHTGGSYHRVQQGSQQNRLRFFTERYQAIGKYLYGYGSFDFDMDRTKNRAWSDVLHTYDANPFISGSAVPGSYDAQDFALNARLASVRLGAMHYGAALSYRVGDLSRLRDPRSRVRLADYQLTPSALYVNGNHTVGLAAWYHRYKEKLVGLKTVQTDPNLKYYIMTGLEYASGTVGGYNGYQREYVNHDIGAELSYGYRSGGLSSVTAASISRATEYVYGQYKYEPGRYHAYHYGLTTRNRIAADRLLHSIEGRLGYDEAYADQYDAQLVTEHDGAYTTQRWERTMTYRKRYQLRKTDLNLHYRLTFLRDDEAAAYVGARYDLQSVSNKHLLPTSELRRAASLMGVEGGCALADGRLWVKAEADRRVSHRADLSLANAATDYAVHVLLPDMDYLQANYWQGRLELTVQQPLSVKGRPTLWYARLHGSYLKTDNALHGHSAGLTVGLYY